MITYLTQILPGNQMYGDKHIEKFTNDQKIEKNWKY